MNADSISILVEAKKEYTQEIQKILRPRIYEGFKSMFDEICSFLLKEVEERRVQNNSVIKTFQKNLKEIPQWNQEMIDREFGRIMTVSNCDYFEQLMEAVFVSNVKILTSIQIGLKKNNLKVKVPSADHFIHKIYIECAKEFYKNPYLFDTNSRSLTVKEKHNNLREALDLIDKSIENAIRECLPMRDILKSGLLQQMAGADEASVASSKKSNKSAKDEKSVQDEKSVHSSSGGSSKEYSSDEDSSSYEKSDSDSYSSEDESEMSGGSSQTSNTGSSYSKTRSTSGTSVSENVSINQEHSMVSNQQPISVIDLNSQSGGEMPQNINNVQSMVSNMIDEAANMFPSADLNGYHSESEISELSGPSTYVPEESSASQRVPLPQIGGSDQPTPEIKEIKFTNSYSVGGVPTRITNVQKLDHQDNYVSNNNSQNGNMNTHTQNNFSINKVEKIPIPSISKPDGNVKNIQTTVRPVSNYIESRNNSKNLMLRQKLLQQRNMRLSGGQSDFYKQKRMENSMYVPKQNFDDYSVASMQSKDQSVRSIPTVSSKSKIVLIEDGSDDEEIILDE